MSTTTVTSTTTTANTINNTDKTSTLTTPLIQETSKINVPGSSKIKATISYLDKSVTKPYQYLVPPPAGEAKNNFVQDNVEKEITDLHGTTSAERVANGFNTNEAGFQILDNAWGKPETAEGWKSDKWEDKEWIESVYYADIDALLKRELGVTSTFIFDHTVRKSQTSHLPDSPENRKPVSQAHCDQSQWAGENRIKKHLGEETLEKVKQGKIHAQLINVWRPMRPVEEHPLAMADSRTVYRGENGGSPDWVESELRYADWTGQTLLIHNKPEHRWYYYKGIEPDQTILLKCYASNAPTRTPHTAFVDPTTDKDAKPRWSIEARVLCLTE